MTAPDPRIGNKSALKWPPEHDKVLKAMVAAGISASDAADQINLQFQTAYTRNACLGRSWRTSMARPARAPRTKSVRTRQERQIVKRREKRWAANPSLQARYERLQEQKRTLALMASKGTPPTAAAYRKHLPRLPDMTKRELRAMLTAAVVTTAALVLQ
jgi:hypothetical protein